MRYLSLIGKLLKHLYKHVPVLISIVSGSYSCGEPNDCGQVCVNVTSEINCSCLPGYQLEPNGYNCTGKISSMYIT